MLFLTTTFCSCWHSKTEEERLLAVVLVLDFFVLAFVNSACALCRARCHYRLLPRRWLVILPIHGLLTDVAGTGTSLFGGSLAWCGFIPLPGRVA